MQKLHKRSILLLLIVQFMIDLYGQDCHTLDSISNFHGINFGAQPNKNIVAIANKIDRDYYLTYNELRQEEKIKYEKLFQFNYQRFDELALGINKLNNVYSITLWSTLSFIDSADLERGKLPFRLSSLLNKSIQLLGKFTRTEEEDHPILNRLYGTKRKWIWECKKVRLTIKYQFGSNTPEFNIIEIELTDIELEKKLAIDDLKN